MNWNLKFEKNNYNEMENGQWKSRIKILLYIKN